MLSVKKVTALYTQGFSLSDIAKQTGKSKASVFRFFKKHDIKTDPKRRKKTPGSKIIRNGYVWVKVKTHPQSNYGGYVREHILVMEKKIRRFLFLDEVVHHIDFNPLNNKFKNLQLMKDKEHKALHAKLRRRNKKGKFICD